MDTLREHSSMQVAVSSALRLSTTFGPASIRWVGSGSTTECSPCMGEPLLYAISGGALR
ncbi:hypothetical protein [Variovorax sp. Root411]|uniref:hypothetical protein n=1 Tax=Variovorax sp. Root411 TaxID=1736530 RepID=UPI000AD95044|nr:hypothetical protein [Variovorax sp. Root411]